MRLAAWFVMAVCGLSAPVLHAADSGVVGTWRGPENSVISITPCGGSLCAKVLSTGNETAARLDTNNPNAALRMRALCGLQIGEGFHGSNFDKAEGGHLYDPRSGKTYKGSMTSKGDVLLLRGYLGVSLLGRTARWERIREPVAVCGSVAPAKPQVPPSLPTELAPSAPATSNAAPTVVHRQRKHRRPKQRRKAQGTKASVGAG